MDITIAHLSEEDRKKLEFIQEMTFQDTESSISAAIDAYYRQLHQENDPLARLKQSPLIGSFQGDPNLSEQSSRMIELPTFDGDGVHEGVNLDSNANLRDRMDGMSP